MVLKTSAPRRRALRCPLLLVLAAVVVVVVAYDRRSALDAVDRSSHELAKAYSSVRTGYLETTSHLADGDAEAEAEPRPAPKAAKKAAVAAAPPPPPPLKKAEPAQKKAAAANVDDDSDYLAAPAGGADALEDYGAGGADEYAEAGGEEEEEEEEGEGGEEEEEEEEGEDYVEEGDYASAAADGDNADDYDYDAVVAGGAKGAKGAKGAAPRPPQPAAPAPPPATRLEALRACSFEDLECVRAAHALPAGGAKFNFPHFMIIGFQKAATTSLNAYLDKHPQVERSWPKEPEFLSKDCNWRLEACPPRATRKYFRATLDVDAYLAKGGSVAHSEASTHYVRNGDRLAVQMRHFMPWLRLVFSLRDPISRAASMLIHKKDKHGDGCLATRPLPECLLEDSQISGNGAGASSTNYSYPVSVWAREWPREQLHVIQYEELTSEEGEDAELTRVKAFIGVDPALPAKKDLPEQNARRFTIAPEGWPMARRQYEALLAIVRPDAAALVATLEGAKLIKSGAAWMARWEAVWDANLASCDGAGPDAACTIQLS